jgi:RimJ/RimL family protein N-acetyltransferase
MTAMPDIALQTPRLRVRLLNEADAPALLEMYADPVAMRYWSHAPLTELEQVQQLLVRDQLMREEGRGMRLGDRLCPGARLLGQGTDA